jgi:hypothetical protein
MRLTNTRRGPAYDHSQSFLYGGDHLDVLFLASSPNCRKRLLASSCLSAWSNSAPTGRIFVKFDIRQFFENLSRK